MRRIPKTTTRHRSLIAWFAAVGLMLMALPAGAEVSRVTIDVDGLACPFCAYGLEKYIRKAHAVADYEIELEAGKVHLLAEPGRSIRLDRLHELIWRAGFTHGDGRLTATGRVRENEGTWTLRADEGQVFLLEPAPASLQEAGPGPVTLEASFDKDQLAASRPVLTDVRHADGE